MSKDLNTEQIILEAAEAEFLEQGYGNAKTVAIAKRAGVSHSMLHYYFRTKENLFQMIFQKKIQFMSHIFMEMQMPDIPFFEIIRRIVELQFDFVSQNPKLPRFVANEIISNEKNRELLYEVLHPKFAPIYDNLDRMVADEIAKGTIRMIQTRDLVLNIIALNVFTFLALPVLSQTIAESKLLADMLNKRKESNVQFILNSLRK
ncbi:MAG: Nucleoid occlusion factor SlmA [Candidatus Ordinivivax streblomastigis]|uniref:Nucleoid occlusion factor SlmA n=1 Tax=Candidatus Ordinivivax streblomastigis TaxID=2540710 RepID=A0A5M8NUG1_9BACT|nr:MAG: Nucleoid occlusion factor SlmA [Candidatus Ordinivivax streblomastigis]